MAPVIIMLLLLFSSLSYADEYSAVELWESPEKIEMLLQSNKLNTEDVPDPHWNDKACVACHTGNSDFNISNLRSNDMGKLCGACHNGYGKTVHVHPTGSKIPARMRKRMPKKFQQSLAGTGPDFASVMTCLTCHDLSMQCLDSRKSEKSLNSKFFRTGPFRNRTEMCFYCHDTKSYQRFSPHDQIVNGKLKKERCNICHVKTDNLESGTRLKDVHFQTKKNISRLCTNCHPWRPHPGGQFSFSKKKLPDHLVKPSEAVLSQMKLMKKKTGVDMPLEPKTGKIHCATCHNPHEKGVIKLATINAGADSKQRLRTKKLCTYCHDF